MFLCNHDIWGENDDRRIVTPDCRRWSIILWHILNLLSTKDDMVRAWYKMYPFHTTQIFNISFRVTLLSHISITYITWLAPVLQCIDASNPSVVASVGPSLPHFNIVFILFSSWILLKYCSLDVKQWWINTRCWTKLLLLKKTDLKIC